jgi:F0F1-type ATP synthase assembly protein I
MDRSPQDSGSSGQGSSGPQNRGSNDAGLDTSSLAGMGVQFLVAILLFLFIGKWLDSRLGTSPWLLILGVFSGATASTVAMYRRIFPPDKTKQTDSSKKQP